MQLIFRVRRPVEPPIKAENWNEADYVKQAVKTTLRNGFGLSHITLESERHGHDCEDAQVVGHSSATN